MLYTVFFILILIAFLSLFTLIRLNILIEYHKDGYDDHFVISLYILNSKLKLKYEIPIIDIEKNGIKFVRFKKSRDKAERVKETKKFSFQTMIDRTIFFKKLYERNKKLFHYVIKYLEKKVIIKELNFSCELGTGSSYYTGILGGISWTFLGIVFSYIENNFKINKKRLDISTNFKQIKFKVDFNCIFAVKIAHIIFIGAKIFVGFLVNFKKIISLKKTIGGDLIG